MTVSECRPSKRQRTLHSPILGDARISSTGFRLPGPTRALGGRSTSTGVRPSDITGDDISRNIHLLFQSSTLIDWERAYVKCKSTLDSFSAQRLAPTGFRVHGEADRLLQSRRGPSAHTEAEDHIRGLIQMKDISTHPQVSIAEALRSDSDRGINFPKGKHPPNMPIPQRGQKVVNREAALPREQAVQASSPGSLYPLTPPLDEILCDHHQSRGGLSESTKLVLVLNPETVAQAPLTCVSVTVQQWMTRSEGTRREANRIILTKLALDLWRGIQIHSMRQFSQTAMNFQSDRKAHLHTLHSPHT